jgi:hypothetical protein
MDKKWTCGGDVERLILIWGEKPLSGNHMGLGHYMTHPHIPYQSHDELQWIVETRQQVMERED